MTHQDQTLRRPALKSRNPEMIPKTLLRGMLALALAALALTTYAVVTGRPTVGQPTPAAVVESRAIILEGLDAQAVRVRAADGTLIADMPHGGFVTVIQSGVATQRRRHGIDPALPVNIVRYENGRLAVEDPETGWSAELYAFGDDNKAAFERLMSTTE